MKKVLSLVLVLGLILSFVPSVGATSRVMDLKLDGEWDFKYYQNASDVPEDVTKIVFEDKIQVPGAMELQGYGYPSYYYEQMGGWGQPEDDGVRSAGVYKLDFEVNEWYSGDVKLVFESFMDEIVLYLDGRKIGESKNGAIGDVFDVNLTEGKHSLICVVKRDKSGINKADDFATSGIVGSVVLAPYGESKMYIERKKVKIEDGKLFIDGNEVVLKGVKYTATHPESGNTVDSLQLALDLELIKNYGFNCVWTSCAPDEFYEIAEEKGLYVIDEANVNLDNVDRDGVTATRRIQRMVDAHGKYGSIIMWSVGHGDASRAQDQIHNLNNLDPSRYIAQEVTFAEDFQVFGNTGGMETWVKTLGDGNVGGFVDEFADKELYYTQNAYLFETKDSVTGEKITIDGEVENYKGTQYLGDASFVRNIDKLDKYTIVTEVGAVDGDRVIFENDNVKFEIRGGRARFNVGDKRARADVYEGKIAAVYQDGEIQLFVNNAFAENAEANAEIEGSYSVGGGDTAISYIEVYNDALTLDELLEGADESKLISRVAFDDINIKEDKSYKFLAYGGDFGDNPNSYYKCLTGLFSSTREPHPEAEAFRVLLNGELTGKHVFTREATEYAKIQPVVLGDKTVFKAGIAEITVDFDGKITSIKKDGVEMLTDAMYPTVLRENTLSEYEMGIENYEGWRRGKAEVRDNTLYVELISTVTNGKLHLAYHMYENGVMNVSMQSEFTDDATKPTFVGFRGAGEFKTVEWLGNEESSYPDRPVAWDIDMQKKAVSEMSDNYAVPQESGNHWTVDLALINKNGTNFGFSSVNGKRHLQFQVLDYSPEAMAKADHDEDIMYEEKAYFRIGGHIAGVSDSSEYKLNENVYGFDFEINAAFGESPKMEVSSVYLDNEVYEAFATGVKSYVYQTNEKVNVTADGAEVVQDDKKAVIGDYTVYFAPDTEYMSDMTVTEKTAQIALDSDFNGNAINMRGNGYWEPSVSYDKGVTIKNGSVTYDISKMNDHVFNAVIGKNDFDWRKMGGGFDRNMFDASCSVTIALDGVVVEEIKDVSMRSGSREVNIDVSGAKEMTITVTGGGRAPAYEDAVLANAAFVPNGPVVVNFEKADGKAKITILNTDEEKVDVVLTATENGIVTTRMTSMGKGLYRTIEIPAGESAQVKAYVTDLGKISLE